jgi:hypothetical protein
MFRLSFCAAKSHGHDDQDRNQSIPRRGGKYRVGFAVLA